MRSRAARLAFGSTAWIAIGAAAFFLFRSEKQIASLASAVRVFDVRAREATDALSDLRVAQQAYVSAGQGLDFWTSKVAVTSSAVGAALDALRQAAAEGGTRSALDEAATTFREFGSIDQRARDYLKSGQQLMAADVIFTEGLESAATAARQVDAARLAEHEAFDTSEAAIRQQQTLALGFAAALAGIVVLCLVPVPRPDARLAAGTVETDRSVIPPAPPELALAVEAPGPRAAPLLEAAASLATDFGRVRDLDELTRLLARAAEAMDASGVIVWMGNSSGADLRPVLAHGYSSRTVGRMPAVPRSADNAAAAAYRSGTLQIVRSRPGGASGAIVAPILSADGCIGALAAEIRGSGEASKSVQALASIIAAHLANVLASTPADAVDTKTAAQG